MRSNREAAVVSVRITSDNATLSDVIRTEQARRFGRLMPDISAVSGCSPCSSISPLRCISLALREFGLRSGRQACGHADDPPGSSAACLQVHLEPSGCALPTVVWSLPPCMDACQPVCLWAQKTACWPSQIPYRPRNCQPAWIARMPVPSMRWNFTYHPAAARPLDPSALEQGTLRGAAVCAWEWAGSGWVSLHQF